MRLGPRPCADDHLTLTTVVTGRITGGAFDARDLATRALPLGDQFDEPRVDVVEVGSEFVQGRHAWIPSFANKGSNPIL